MDESELDRYTLVLLRRPPDAPSFTDEELAAHAVTWWTKQDAIAHGLAQARGS
jgi:lysylphosphatidylglycerol synthetase-like protein (DUF2156 family)